MNKSPGVALIMVLLVTSLLSVLSLQFWFLTGLQYDLIRQREEFYTHLYDTQGVLDSGLVEIQHNFMKIVSQLTSQKTSIRLDQGNRAKKNIVVSITQSKESGDEHALLVTAENKEKECVRCCLRCLVFKRQGSYGEQLFVVECFTLGSSI